MSVAEDALSLPSTRLRLSQKTTLARRVFADTSDDESDAATAPKCVLCERAVSDDNSKKFQGKLLRLKPRFWNAKSGRGAYKRQSEEDLESLDALLHDDPLAWVAYGGSSVFYRLEVAVVERED